MQPTHDMIEVLKEALANGQIIKPPTTLDGGALKGR